MRVRIRFSKLGKVRFTSHRDLARIWERALRKAEVPVAYSAGFSPRPKVSFGLALSTGHESLAEYLDVDVATEGVAAGEDGTARDGAAGEAGTGTDVASLPERLTPALPVGMEVTAAEVIEPGTPSLQESVTSCTWQIEVLGAGVAELHEAVGALLTADTVLVARQRKGKDVVDDVRAGVVDVEVIGATDGGVQLEAVLLVHPRSVRPAELLSGLASVAPGAPTLVEGRVRRISQWIDSGGARVEPLPDATLRPHAEVRAS